MKKRLLSVLILVLSVVLLSSCSIEVATNGVQSTTIDGQSAIDRNSIVSDIYSRVYSQIESELKEELYNELMEKYGSGTVEWETIQEQVYNVIEGPGQSNISVTNYQKNTNGEVAAASYGSGVIFEVEELSEGEYKYRYYAITNEHVVEGGLKYSVGFYDESSIDATLIASDATTDVAVLYFDTDRIFTVAELGDSDTVKPGTFVVAIGNPKGETLFGTTTFGMVSGVDRHLIENDSVNTFLSYIQHDAAINSGNSGGALYSLDGKVIGINSAKYASSDIEGLGFSIPINLVKQVVYELREYGSYSGTVSFGISCADVEDLLNAGRELYQVPDDVTEGVVVVAISEGGSCDGILEVNDIIIKANGEQIKTSDDLAPIRAGAKLGDTVTLTILRAGEEMDVVITFKRAK